MYELFTDRARKVMQLANQAAQRFNHEYIGTEHVLIGLIKEGTGTGASVLQRMGAELRLVLSQVEKDLQTGPEMITMGKLPKTPQTKRCIQYMMEEANELCHQYVGTEHVLLGLLREQEGVAAEVLARLGINIKATREEVLNQLCRMEKEELSRSVKKAEVEGKAWLGKWSKGLTARASIYSADYKPLLDQPTVEKILHTLMRRQNNNVLLVGDRLLAREYVRLIAYLSHHGPIPTSLNEIDIRQLLKTVPTKSGVSEFADRVIHCFNEALDNGNVVLVIEPMEQLYDIELAEVGTRLGTALKPWLDAPVMRCIGLTDQAGKDGMSNFGSLQHFEVVELPQMTQEQTNAAMFWVLEELGLFHICKFSNEAVKAATKAVGQHLADSGYPPIEIEQLLDEAAVQVLANLEVQSDEVAEVDTQLRRVTKLMEASYSRRAYAKGLELEEKAKGLLARRNALCELTIVNEADVAKVIARRFEN